MVKLSTLFWMLLVSTTGFAMFAVKYGVQSLEEELYRTKRATIAEEHAIRADEAEWAYLTRPETLDEMNRRHLSLGPIATKQLRITLGDIPMRVASSVASDASVEHPLDNALSTVPTPTDAPTSTENPTEDAELVKPSAPKALAKPVLSRRPRSLDELISQVAASR